MNMPARLKSPLRYPGGKARMADDILAFFPKPLPKVIISGFMGGGGLELRLCALGTKVLACDLEVGVAAFWKVMMIDRGGSILAREAREYYQKLSHSKAAAQIWFQQIKAEYREIAESGILSASDTRRIALLFYVINRVSRDGIFTSGSIASDNNRPPDDNRSWLPRFQLTNIGSLESFKMPEGLVVIHEDYSFLLERCPDSFFYGDPPYYANGRCRLYGRDGNLHEGFDHCRLKDSLQNHKGGWVLSYDLAARRMYEGYEIREVEMGKSMGVNKGRRQEILIRG